MNTLDTITEKISLLLKSRVLILSVAESCTGGWVAQVITSVSGSSQYFDRGFVTYSNQSKIEMLGVKSATLETFGAVSEETAREMAQGALTHSHADISLSVTGIAGPDGGTPEKPVGTVWFAWANKKGVVKTQQVYLSGDRTEIRRQSVLIALEGIIDLVTIN